jgi:hypothetical protein
MSDRDEFYNRFSKSYDKLYLSEKQDDLVERVARAIRHWYNDDAPATDRPSTVAARAAIAVALEEAAKVCERRFMGDHNREDMEARRCAAAIRALITKENK